MLIGGIALWIFLAGLVGAYAARKKMGFLGGFFLSVILTPIIGFIIVLLSADKEDIEESARKESWKAYQEEAQNLERKRSWKEALKKYQEALYALKRRDEVTEKSVSEEKATEIEKKINELKTRVQQV